MTDQYPILLFTKIYDGDKWYVAEVPDLKGCSASAKTPAQAIKRVEEAIAVYKETSSKLGQSVPPIEDEANYSGRFVTRVSRDLHRSLRTKSKEKGVSLNTLVNSIIKSALDSVINERDAKLDKVLELVAGIPELQRTLKHHFCPFVDIATIQYDKPGKQAIISINKTETTFPVTLERVFS